MTTAITVDNIGKKYRLGHEVKRAATAREAVRNAVSAPFRYLKYRLAEATEEDTLWACRNISFDVKQGEVLGIVGANGAGKSTLLKILSRITDPTEGRAVIRGRVNALLEVGVGFHPELTGRENVYLNAALHGLSARATRARLDTIVQFSGVERFLDTPVKRYSSGMKVRLGFAVAANLDPDILIIDEVLAVGDAEFQKKCLGKIEDVTKLGRTVLFVSHNMMAVQSLCDRAIWLRNGRLYREGSGDEIVRWYLQNDQVIRAEQSWAIWAEAPGTEELRIRRISVHNPGAREGEPIGRLQPIVFLMEYEKREATPYVGSVNMHVMNEQGVLLFGMTNNTIAKERQTGREAGVYTLQCTLPAHLMNPGMYFIKATIADGEKVVWMRDGILSFEVVDDEKRNLGEFNYSRSKGVLWPRLEYQLSRSQAGRD